jgi:hypothetical protein
MTNIFDGDGDNGSNDTPNDGEVSHPSDPDPTPGATEYEPLGEPSEGDIYVPSED